MRIYIFYRKGKARDVFHALYLAAMLESKFGRQVEPLETSDFGVN